MANSEKRYRLTENAVDGQLSSQYYTSQLRNESTNPCLCPVNHGIRERGRGPLLIKRVAFVNNYVGLTPASRRQLISEMVGNVQGISDSGEKRSGFLAGGAGA